MRRLSLAIILLAPIALAACTASTNTGAYFWPVHPGGSVHTLMPSPTTVVYGGYDPDAAPVLRVASGDEVIVGAVSTCGARLLQPGVDTGTIEPAYRAIVAAARDSTLRRGPGGHILTGPIYVDGAEPGDVLEVRIESITVDLPFACNGFGPRGGFLPEDFPGVSRSRVIPLDLQHMVAHFSDSLGIAIPLHPFFGSIGVAPSPEQGRINSAPPGTHAGNLDNKALVAGTILYIPVHTRGALLEIGDGHAGQGDGEVDITALETSLRGKFQLIVRKDMHLRWPRAETPTHYMTMGLSEDLNQAAKIATREMLAFIVATKGLPRDDVLMLLSAAMDLHVTEIVDGTKGVHAMLPKAIFQQ